MRAMAIVVAAVLVAGGIATMSPGARLRNELFWEAPVECESRYRTLHLDQIDVGGGITLRADAESRSEIQPFTNCYRSAVDRRIQQRRQAGLTIPEELLAEPAVEID